jgi:flagellar biosynthesis regulator FlbT
MVNYYTWQHGCFRSFLKSGGLMIECQRNQQSLNLLSLKQIHNITISSNPHKALNTSRGIIRYRDDYLDNLSDEEICKELAPSGYYLCQTIDNE